MAPTIHDALSNHSAAILIMKVLLSVVVCLALAACATPSSKSAMCEQAALSQALAEQRLAVLFDQHADADEMLAAHPDSAEALRDHDESNEFFIGARVDMILAEAETRRQCG